MTRNLDRRIEIICPIYDKFIQQQIRIIFDTSWNENQKARVLDDKLSNNFRKVNKNEQPFRSQFELYKILEEFMSKCS